MARKFDLEPVCCGVCARQAWGIGYAPKQGKPVLWLCQSTDCISLGRVVFHMTPSRLTVFERDSLKEAGSSAGAYLERIGKFDLSELDEDQWFEFLSIVLKDYGENMRTKLLAHDAPF